jgi:TolA-binding protein
MAVMTMAVSLVAVSQAVRADATSDFNLALQLYKQERWDLAAVQLRQFLQTAPDHPQAPLAQLYLGQSLVHLRQFAEARPVFREFVQTQPEHRDIALARYRVAECSYFLNDASSARTEFREFLNSVPADHFLAEWALQYLGEAELQLGHAEDAADAFSRQLASFQDGQLADEARFGLARASEQLNRADDAAALYRQLAANPQGARAADARFHLAAQLFEAEQYAEASQAFDSLARTFPQHRYSVLAQLNAGYSKYHLGDFPGAIAYFKRIVDDENVGRTARYWIGLSEKAQRDFDRAADTLLALYREDEQQPLAENILYHTADSRLASKSYAEAKETFLAVADRFPNGELADDALHSAIDAALLAGELDEAEQLHRRFSEQFPASGLRLPADLLYGRLLLTRGDELLDDDEGATPELAQQTYQRAAETFRRVMEASQIPETKRLARLQLAVAWDRLEDHQRVIETLDPLVAGALAEDATDEQLRALVMQSTAWLALKDFERAHEAARQYLGRNPEGEYAADTWANVAAAQAHRQQWESARAALEKVDSLGDRELSTRMRYEVAEAAYDARVWEMARTLYEQIVERGTDGEFYMHAVSGLAYSLYEDGAAAATSVDQAQADGQSFDETILSDAVQKLDAAARWFGRLSELAGRTDNRLVQSNAGYMQGLSLKLAGRGQPAADIFVTTAREFSLPEGAAPASPEQHERAYNAFRSWKEAARTFAELRQIPSADEAYEAAYEQLRRQPVERLQELDHLLNEWALLHYNNKDYERSDELFRLLISESPKSEWADDARLLLAESEFFADKFEAARTSFRQIVSDPAADEFVRQRALLLLIDSAVALTDWETVTEAATALRELLRQSSPDDHDRWYAEYRLGEAKLRREDWQGAALDLKQLIDQHLQTEVGQAEWFPMVWPMLAEAQLRLKEYPAVDETVAQFKRQYPESPFTYQLDEVLGRRFANEGRFDEARQAFQRVIDSRDGRGTETAAKAQFHIAESLLKQANAADAGSPHATELYDQAFLAYYRVLEYGFPEWQALALWQAGRCDEALHRFSGAKKSYEQLISDYPDSPYAAQARDRLMDLNRRFPAGSQP